MSYRKRVFFLIIGQPISSLGVAALVQANIGLDPWGALHQGLSNVTGLSFGICTILVGALAILISALLKEPLSVGTIVSVIAPGIFVDLFQGMGLIPQMQGLWSGVALMLLGQVMLALGTYFYMAAAMGAGPRDALMVAVSRPLHLQVGVCRTVIEITALILGYFMGAKIGVGTIIAALTIGPALQAVFALFHYDPKTVHHDSFSELWMVFRRWVRREPPEAPSPMPCPSDNKENGGPA
ncbi:membrane protein [Oscillospiraceae bacterium]|nr:membrane protein [Oscillospiraceae bacterium]